MATENETLVINAYIGLFGRAPDRPGLDFWVSQLEAKTAELGDRNIAIKQLANALIQNPATGQPGAEWAAGFGSFDIGTTDGKAQLVQALYQSLFGRAANGSLTDTSTDLGYWASSLSVSPEPTNPGSFTAAEMALVLIQAATENPTTPDGIAVAAKVQAAEAYTNAVGNAPREFFESAAFTAGAKAAVAGVVNADTAAASVARTNASGPVLTVDNAALTEGQTATFTVTLTVPVTEDVTLSYQLEGATANPAVEADVSAVSGTLSFSANSTTATFTITATADQETEGTEGFVVKLLDSAGQATLLTSQTITIADAATGGEEQPVPPAPPAEPQALQINDPLFAAQWYIENTGQREANGPVAGTEYLDLNIRDVWNMGYTGKGIKVGVSDDGMDLDHPDLQAALLKDLTFNSANGVTGATAYQASGNFNPDGKTSNHGTVVGSIIGMAANNNEGMVGIAHGANLVSTLVLGADGSDTKTAFTHLIDTAKVDIAANSFGNDPAFSESYYIAPGTAQQDLNNGQLEGQIIKRAATEGRDGKGIFFTVAAGNEAGTKADAGMTNFTSSIYTSAIGAMDQNGVKTEYTSPGASVLVSAFGGTNPNQLNQSENAGYGAVSADINGAGGYNTTDGDAGSYAYQNEGTSYANPMVAAIAALMLEANPNLGFRDISTILAITARGTGAESNNYVTNAANNWNFGGMHFSRDVGFGLADAAAAVQLAESWQATPGTVANWVSASGASNAVGAVIPDGDSQTGLTVTAQVSDAISIERVEFQLSLDANSPKQLMATITSPSGTTITLFDQPRTQFDINQETGEVEGAENPWPGVFSIMSTAFLGETSQGDWTLKLFDKVTGEEASYQSFNVVAWGTASNDTLFLTDELTAANATNKVLAAGVTTIQAAALSEALVIDLSQNSGSVGGEAFSYSNDSATAEVNVIGGSGNDSITGDSAANMLSGNRGNDTLTGGDGADQLRGGLGADSFVLSSESDSNSSAQDTILDFISGRDSINLSAIDANSNEAGDQAFAWAGFNSAGSVTAYSLSYSKQGDNILLVADTNGDTTADVSILLSGIGALAQTDFVL